MKNFKFFYKNKQKFIAFFVLLVFLFNACKDPIDQIINEPVYTNPITSNLMYSFVDDNG